MIETCAAISLQPLQLFTGKFLYWAVVFIALAIIAGLAGFRGIAGLTMGVAKLFIFVFLVLAIVSLIL